MKRKLYAVPFIIISCFTNAMDDPIPPKPVKAIIQERGKEPRRAQQQLDPDVVEKVPEKEILSQKSAPLITTNLQELVKQANYVGSRENTLTYSNALIDYLKKQHEDSSMIIRDRIKELTPLLEEINNTSNPEIVQSKIWNIAHVLISFSKTLAPIAREEREKPIKEYVKRTLEQIEQEKIAKENNLFARLKRLAKSTYSNVSDWLSPVSNMQYSLMFRAILVPLAYFFSEKQ